MGYRIELWTEHEDNGAAIHALASRVGEDSLTLTSGEDVPTGEWVAFEVKLADGSVFLEGMGRCQGSEARDPLWDIELGMLQLDTRDQMLFERLQLAAEDLETGSRPTGEVDISKLEAQAEKSEEKPAPPPPPKVPPKLPPKEEQAAKPPALPPKDAAATKKQWPWQKTTEPGIPSPEPSTAPSVSTPVSKPPPVSAPPSVSAPPPVSAPPAVSAPPVSKPPPTPAIPTPSKTPPGMDPPIPPILRQRLMNVMLTLVAEGRVRDLAGAHALALRIGLQALETLLEDED